MKRTTLNSCVAPWYCIRLIHQHNFAPYCCISILLHQTITSAWYCRHQHSNASDHIASAYYIRHIASTPCNDTTNHLITYLVISVKNFEYLQSRGSQGLRSHLNHVDELFSFCTKLSLHIALPKPWSRRGTSCQPAFMSGCLTIGHTCLPCLSSRWVSILCSWCC